MFACVDECLFGGAVDGAVHEFAVEGVPDLLDLGGFHGAFAFEVAEVPACGDGLE